MGKKDGWEKLVDLWTGKDPDFMAKSIQNSNNHGHEGTHCQGNRDFYRYKDSQVYMEQPTRFPDNVSFLCIPFVLCILGGR